MVEIPRFLVEAFYQLQVLAEIDLREEPRRTLWSGSECGKENNIIQVDYLVTVS